LANLRTTADILDEVLRRCGELTDGNSSYEASALRYVNNAYRSILSGGNEFGIDVGEPWVWAQATSPQLLTLLPAYTTGTITVTADSTTASFSSAPSYSVAGWFLILEGVSDVFVASAHTASLTPITLDLAFTGTSGSYNFKAVKLDYALSTAVCRLVAPMVCYKSSVYSGPQEQGKIYEIDTNTMIRKYPLMTLAAGIPDRYTVTQRGTTDLITVRFNGYPDAKTRVEIPYIPVQADLTDSDSSIPVVPFGYRDVLVHMASYYLMLDKSDNRADSEAAIAKAKLLSLVHNNRKQLSLAGNNYGRLIPRRSAGRRRYSAE
jgi:hypothetical protein